MELLKRGQVFAMRITQWGELGIQFSSYICQRESAGENTVAASEIAQALDLDIQYVHQILHKLRKGGILESVRGPSGGFRLAKSAEQISLLDLLIAAEGETFEVICETKPLHANCGKLTEQGQNCSLMNIWYDLKKHVDSFLSSYSLKDLSAMPFPSLTSSEGKLVKLGQGVSKE